MHAESAAEEGAVLLDVVEELAEAHGAHAQLMDLCEALQDPGRLHSHMQVCLLHATVGCMRATASTCLKTMHSCCTHLRTCTTPDSHVQACLFPAVVMDTNAAASSDCTAACMTRASRSACCMLTAAVAACYCPSCQGSLTPSDGCLQRSLEANRLKGCAQYVFGRLRSEGRCNQLLSLPDVFDEALTAWLKEQVSTLSPSCSPAPAAPPCGHGAASAGRQAGGIRVELVCEGK